AAYLDRYLSSWRWRRLGRTSGSCEYSVYDADGEQAVIIALSAISAAHTRMTLLSPQLTQEVLMGATCAIRRFIRDQSQELAQELPTAETMGTGALEELSNELRAAPPRPRGRPRRRTNAEDIWAREQITNGHDIEEVYKGWERRLSPTRRKKLKNHRDTF